MLMIRTISYLSESKTKCWLSGSFRAYANNRLSASTIENAPHVTYKFSVNKKINRTIIVEVVIYQIAKLNHKI